MYQVACKLVGAADSRWAATLSRVGQTGPLSSGNPDRPGSGKRDGAWLDQTVAGVGRRALVVAGLHGRQVLALRAASGERAVAAEQILASLIAEHGAPLVLKLDNGSAFTAMRFARFCRAHGITLLHSPVRRPRLNGTCEVSGRWAKHRAQAAEACAGRQGRSARRTSMPRSPSLDPSERSTRHCG